MTNYERITGDIGKREIFLLNDFEGCVMRIPRNHGGIYLMKFQGGQEYEIKYSAKLACDTKFDAKEITKEQYEKY